MNNSKIVSTKRTSAIFLAIVLVTGTIALSFPSSITNAQAQPYYYDEKDNYKSKDSSSSNINVKKIKCNNINVNINNGNGGNGNTTNGDSSTNENETNNGFKKFNKDDFAFVCINNNNNIVIGVGNQTIPPEPQSPCEECFTNSLTITQINILLDGVEESLQIIRDINLEDLCTILDLIENSPEETITLARILSEIDGVDAEDTRTILLCLAQLGLIEFD